MPDRGEDLIQARREKLQKLIEAGVDPYPAVSNRTHNIREASILLLQDQTNEELDRSPNPISIVGRVVAMRVMGRVAFMDLQDETGQLQIQLRKDLLDQAYDLIKFLDLGDFIEVRGPLFRTRTGEVTVEVDGFRLLSKALRPPPAKWYGLKDVEQRYRRRETDLLANQETRDRFILRSQVVSGIRGFLNDKGFMEVETPILIPVPAGAMARPFVTRHNALDRTLYLRIATELYLKRCIIGGLEKVFEIGRVFRNEGLDANHNPEFTTLETYHAYVDYRVVMEMLEEMISSLAETLLGSSQINWRSQTLDLKPPWRRLELRTALKSYANIDIEAIPDAAKLADEMRALGIKVTQEESWGRLVDKLLSETIEPFLTQPTFLLDYPIQMSPLAKAKAGDPSYVERFEAFIGGMEIANAFTELNDPLEQRRRFGDQEELRKAHGNEDFDRLDEDFLTALEYGMPPTGGMGLGIDRLVMLFAGQTSIREVLLFPHLSWSQEEVFRVVDQEVSRLIETGNVEAGTLVAQLKQILPSEILDRITTDQLESRVHSHQDGN